MRLKGYVVLYLEKGEPFVLDSRVFRTAPEADGLAKIALPKNSYWVNAVDIYLPDPVIVNPKQE